MSLCSFLTPFTNLTIPKLKNIFFHTSYIKTAQKEYEANEELSMQGCLDRIAL